MLTVKKMYHPGENCYQRNSRFEQWQHGMQQNRHQNNGNYVRGKGTRMGTRYSRPWRGSWNSNRNGRWSQKERRSSSCGPQTSFRNQSWKEQQNLSDDFQIHLDPSQQHRQPRNFVTYNYKNTSNLGDTSSDGNESKKYLGAQQEHHAFHQNPNGQVPEGHYSTTGEPAHTTENQAHRKEHGVKLYVINKKVDEFIRAYVPTDLQPHAKSAFEKINARIITKTSTYHCHYCSLRCRTQQDLENHKKTSMHIKKRNKFVKNWSKTIECPNNTSHHNVSQRNLFK